MSIVYTNNLDMHSGGVPLIVHLGQYDSDFSLVFNLYSSVGALTIESGTTAEIRGTKSDGFGYSADATIDIVNKKVTVAGSNQMTAAARQNIFELVLLKNNKVLSSANFILDVEHAALDADTIQDESVLKELNAIIEGAATATQAAEDAEDAADRAEEAADDLSGTVQQVATNTQDIANLKDDLSHEVHDIKEYLIGGQVEPITLEWAVGGLDAQGDPNPSQLNRLYSNVVSLEGIQSMSVGTGGKISPNYYNDNNEYLGNLGSWVTSFTSSDGSSAYSNAKYVRVLFARSNDSNVSLTDIETYNVVYDSGESEEFDFDNNISKQFNDVKDSLDYLQEEIDSFSGGLTPEIKVALLNCFAKVGWIDDNGQSYYDALETALYADNIDHITAVLNLGAHQVIMGDDLDSLRDYLTVTIYYQDETQEVTSNYELTGDVSTEGTKTVTVKVGRRSTSVTVPVTWGYRLKSPEIAVGGIVFDYRTYDTIKYFQEDNTVRYSNKTFLPWETGYDCYVEADTALDVVVSVNVFNQLAMNAVSNHQNINSNNVGLPGWQTSNPSLTVIPDSVNNSPTKTIRVTFKKVPTDTAFSANDITEVRITRRAK